MVIGSDDGDMMGMLVAKRSDLVVERVEPVHEYDAHLTHHHASSPARARARRRAAGATTKTQQQQQQRGRSVNPSSDTPSRRTACSCVELSSPRTTCDNAARARARALPPPSFRRRDRLLRTHVRVTEEAADAGREAVDAVDAAQHLRAPDLAAHHDRRVGRAAVLPRLGHALLEHLGSSSSSRQL